MRKILGIVVLAMSLIGSTIVVLAQSNRDLTEPTGTAANQQRLQGGGYYGSYGYYGGGYRSYAYSPGLHRRWHWYRRHRFR
jgi:hypothetical protein